MFFEINKTNANNSIMFWNETNERKCQNWDYNNWINECHPFNGQTIKIVVLRGRDGAVWFMTPEWEWFANQIHLIALLMRSSFSNHIFIIMSHFMRPLFCQRFSAPIMRTGTIKTTGESLIYETMRYTTENISTNIRAEKRYWILMSNSPLNTLGLFTTLFSKHWISPYYRLFVWIMLTFLHFFHLIWFKRNDIFHNQNIFHFIKQEYHWMAYKTAIKTNHKYYMKWALILLFNTNNDKSHI